MYKKTCLGLLLAILTVITGCRSAPERIEKPDYNKPLGRGVNALIKVTNPLNIPDFTVDCYKTSDLVNAVRASLNYLKKPSVKQFFPCSGISHERNIESIEEFLRLLNAEMSPRQLNSAILEKFDVYMSVGCDDEGTVLFTGYYTPVFKGSLKRTGKFKYPLYSTPDDLVKTPAGEILGRKRSNGLISPYPSRAVIENAMMLHGSELVWLADAFEAYIASVQGSAKIKLPNEEIITLGYAANNGHEYKSVGKAMMAAGAVTADQLSLDAMIAYFKQNPGDVKRYTHKNPRYVFFKKSNGPPRGSINEPVTALRTIATDKLIFPRAALTFISTKLPAEINGAVTQKYYSGFALDQDAGGAIRAPGRCDVYMGIGFDAGRLAGQTYKEGKLYYLFIKE